MTLLKDKEEPMSESPTSESETSIPIEALHAELKKRRVELNEMRDEIEASVDWIPSITDRLFEVLEEDANLRWTIHILSGDESVLAQSPMDETLRSLEQTLTELLQATKSLMRASTGRDKLSATEPTILPFDFESESRRWAAAASDGTVRVSNLVMRAQASDTYKNGRSAYVALTAKLERSDSFIKVDAGTYRLVQGDRG
jgi:hypothetical protein